MVEGSREWREGEEEETNKLPSLVTVYADLQLTHLLTSSRLEKTAGGNTELHNVDRGLLVLL